MMFKNWTICILFEGMEMEPRTPLNKAFMVSKKCEGNPVLVDLPCAVYNVNTGFTCDISDNFRMTLYVIFYFDK